MDGSRGQTCFYEKGGEDSIQGTKRKNLNLSVLKRAKAAHFLDFLTQLGRGDRDPVAPPRRYGLEHLNRRKTETSQKDI